MIIAIFMALYFMGSQNLTAMEKRALTGSEEEVEEQKEALLTALSRTHSKSVRFELETKQEPELLSEEPASEDVVEETEEHVKSEDGSLSTKARSSKKSRLALKVGKRLEKINKKGARALTKSFLDQDSPTAQLWLTETADEIKKEKKVQQALKLNPERYSAAKELAGELYDAAKSNIQKNLWPAFVTAKKQNLKDDAQAAQTTFELALIEASELFTEFRRNQLLLEGPVDNEKLKKEVDEEITRVRFILEMKSACDIYEGLLEVARTHAHAAEKYRLEELDTEHEVQMNLCCEILEEAEEYYAKYILNQDLQAKKSDIKKEEITKKVESHFLNIRAVFCLETIAMLWKLKMQTAFFGKKNRDYLKSLLVNAFEFFCLASDKKHHIAMDQALFFDSCLACLKDKITGDSSNEEIQNQLLCYFFELNEQSLQK